MDKVKYKVTYITNFDLGYQFRLPLDENARDKENIKTFFNLLQQHLKSESSLNNIMELSDKGFYHCMKHYKILDMLEIYFMQSGTVMLVIKNPNIYEIPFVEGFSKKIFEKRMEESKEILKEKKTRTIYNDVVDEFLTLQKVCYSTMEEFISSAKIYKYRLRKMTYNAKPRFGNFVGLSYLHCIYDFLDYSTNEMFINEVSKLINYYEKNAIESDGEILSQETLYDFSNDFKCLPTDNFGFEFSRQAWAKYNTYPIEQFEWRIIYYLDQWYNAYNLIYNIRLGKPVKKDEHQKNVKYKEYTELELVTYENALDYMYEKLNNTEAEIIPELCKTINKRIVEELCVKEYIKKTLNLIKEKQNISECKQIKKSRRSTFIIKLSTLIFTALSAYETTIDIIHQTFTLSDGIVLAAVIMLFITTLFIDSVGTKK